MDEQTALTGKDWMAQPATGAMDEYLHLVLVRAFPLASIRDEAHLREALAVIDRLLCR